ncbi:MAG: TadE family protein [Planctomycetota bacterium]
MNPVQNSRKNRHSSKRGVAVVELAVCLPVLTLITLATIEASAMIFLQQSLSIAAYEGARVSLVPDATEENARYQAELILTGRDVVGASVNVTPSNFESSSSGTWIQIETSAPFAQNSLAGGWLFNGHTLSASVEMMKEQ